MMTSIAIALLGAIPVMFADAQGQSADQVVDVAWRLADQHAYAVTASGAIFATAGYCQPWSQVGSLPSGCAPVSILDGDVGGSLDIACADGRIYTLQGTVPNVSVVLCSNVFGSTVPMGDDSIGSLKRRYDN